MMFTSRQEQWHYYFYYEDGNLIWTENASSRVRGKIAGFITGSYLQIRLEGKAYAVHKVIYEMHFGDIDGVVDHEDRDKLNNSIENLRPATKSQNEANTPKRCTNTSGYKGVYWLANANKWRAKIDFNKKQIHIGLFEDIKDAALAYNRKALELFGEFAFLNKIEQDDAEVA